MAVTVQELQELHLSAPPMEGPACMQGLPVGDRAPDFALPNSANETVRLSDFRGQPVVLVFYPLDWSPGCSKQLELYQFELPIFAEYGAEILGISVDSMYSHGAWEKLREISFPLLSDFHPKGDAARAYQAWRENDGFSERALYVVDREGIIRYAHVSPYLHHVPDIEELFAVLAELQEKRTKSDV